MDNQETLIHTMIEASNNRHALLGLREVLRNKSVLIRSNCNKDILSRLKKENQTILDCYNQSCEEEEKD